MATFSIWKSDEGDVTLVPGDDPPRFADGRLQARFLIRLKVFEADSWDEAVRIHDALFTSPPGDMVPPVASPSPG